MFRKQNDWINSQAVYTQFMLRTSHKTFVTVACNFLPDFLLHKMKLLSREISLPKGDAVESISQYLIIYICAESSYENGAQFADS